MRKIICENCKGEFLEEDSNPNVHYSNPAKICSHCKMVEHKNPGDYYQNTAGEYIKK